MKNYKMLMVIFSVVFLLGLGCKSKPDIKAEAGDIREIYAGVANVYILREDNSLWGTGYKYQTELTRISDDAGNPFSGVKTVAAGERHTVILREDGTLWGAGDSANGELGLWTARVDAFTQLKADNNPVIGVKNAAAGNNSTFFIDSEGSLWASGYNYYGELGPGNRNVQLSFSKIESAGRNIKSIAAGIRHTVLLKEDGTLWAAGYNFNGQLGLGDTEDRFNFTEVKDAGSDIIAIGAGSYHTVILKSDGSVWTAGSNYWGQLGFAGKNDRLTFTRVSDENSGSLTGVKEIAARGNITVLLKADGALLLTGNYTDTEGRIDLSPDAIQPPTEEKSPAGNDEKSSFISLGIEQGEGIKFGGVKKIILGYNSIYVISSDGYLWAAGSNRYGQLSLSLDTEILQTLKIIN